MIRLHMNPMLARNSLHPRVRVQVLVQRDLEQARAPLPARNDAPREEEGPDAEPALAVLGEHLLLVRQPVLVPAPEGRGVVATEDVDGLDFEAWRGVLARSASRGVKGW